MMDGQQLYTMLPVMFIVFLILILKSYIINNWGLGLFFFIILDFLPRNDISRNSLLPLTVAVVIVMVVSQPYCREYVNRVISFVKHVVRLIVETFGKMMKALEVIFFIETSPRNSEKVFRLKKKRKKIIVAPEFKQLTVFPARLESVNHRALDRYAQRFATFSNISRNSIPNQCHYFDDLAKCGFFYDRVDLSVRCCICTSRFPLHSVPESRRDWHVQWCRFHSPTASPTSTHVRAPNSGHQLTAGGRQVTSERPEENDCGLDDQGLNIGRREAYKTYRARFDSLRDKPWAREPNTARTLARFGMYYGDVGDKLYCFSCNFFITDWSVGRRLVNIRELHTQFDPRCPALRPQDDRM